MAVALRNAILTGLDQTLVVVIDHITAVIMVAVKCDPVTSKFSTFQKIFAANLESFISIKSIKIAMSCKTFLINIFLAIK